MSADGQVIFGADAAVRGLRLPDPFPQLTARERQILALVAEGRDNPDIGRRLGISPKTAANHISAILAKLGVADRTQAALLGQLSFRRSDSG